MNANAKGFVIGRPSCRWTLALFFMVGCSFCEGGPSFSDFDERVEFLTAFAAALSTRV